MDCKILDTHEGEGYFGSRIRKTHTDKVAHPYISLNIHQVDRRALERVANALGFGKIDGPYGPYSGNKQAHYQFVLGDFEHVQAAIAMLWRWLGPVKREQARLALVRAKEARQL